MKIKNSQGYVNFDINKYKDYNDDVKLEISKFNGNTGCEHTVEVIGQDIDEDIGHNRMRVYKTKRPWPKEEEEALKKCVEKFGTSWSKVSKVLKRQYKIKDRTRYDCNNKWQRDQISEIRK